MTIKYKDNKLILDQKKYLTGSILHLFAITIFFIKREYYPLDDFIKLSTMIDLVIISFFNPLMILPFDYLIKYIQPKSRLNMYYFSIFLLATIELYLLDFGPIKYFFLLILTTQIIIAILAFRNPKKSHILTKLSLIPLLFGIPVFFLNLISIYIFLGY